MSGSDSTRSVGASPQGPGRPADLTQAEIEALAKGGRKADSIRERMEAESSRANVAQAAVPGERGAGGNNAPELEPPAESKK